MTAPKSTLRQRRRTTVENLPGELVAWFEGEPRRADQSSVPWSALIFPDYALLPARWLIWRAEHPDASPPVGHEWLDDPASPRHPTAELVTQAERIVRRRK